VCEAKIANKEVSSIPADGKVFQVSSLPSIRSRWNYVIQEVETRQISILFTEEVLLEALCFDFVVDSPHADLVDLFDSHSDDILVQEYAWSIAHDS
jgi:cyclin K